MQRGQIVPCYSGKRQLKIRQVCMRGMKGTRYNQRKIRRVVLCVEGVLDAAGFGMIIAQHKRAKAITQRHPCAYKLTQKYEN